MTGREGAPTLAPESSDGFASVGTASHRKGRPVAGRPFCFVEKWAEIRQNAVKLVWEPGSLYEDLTL